MDLCETCQQPAVATVTCADMEGNVLSHETYCAGCLESEYPNLYADVRGNIESQNELP